MKSLFDMSVDELRNECSIQRTTIKQLENEVAELKLVVDAPEHFVIMSTNTYKRLKKAAGE